MSLRTVFASLLSGACLMAFPVAYSIDTEQSGTQPDTTTSTPDSTALRLPLFGAPQETVNTSTTPEALGTLVGPETGETAIITAEPAPPRPDVLAESAIAYGSYQNDVSTFKRELESTQDIEAAMTVLGTHNPERLAAGWLSYSALLAAQSEEFREGVEDTANYHGRERLFRGMRNDPAYTLSLDGADDALARALAASDADARRLDLVGEDIKDQAYSLQSLGWARARLSGRASDHAQTLRNAAEIGRPLDLSIRTLFEGEETTETLTTAQRLGARTSLWDQLQSTGSELRLPGLPGLQLASAPAPAPLPRPVDPNLEISNAHRITAGNIATLAALHILDETEETTPYVSAALNDRQTQGCFEQAQLNLLQCVSASHNVFERPFCIGVHALKDIGECVGEITE